MRGNFTLGQRTLRTGLVRFYARWRDDEGVSRSKPIDAIDRKDALGLIRQMNENRVDGRLRVSADEALQDFLTHVGRNRAPATLRYYRKRLEPLWEAWKRAPLSGWNRRMLERYVADRSSWGPRTVQMLVSACRRFITWAHDNGLEVPDFVGRFKGPAVHRKAPETLTPAQLDALLAAAEGHRLEPAIALAGLAGLRHAELMRLQAADIQWKRQRIVVRHTKTHRDRHVPISARLEEILKRHRRLSGPVVRAGALEHPSPRLRDLKALCRAAKVPEISWHPLRHTFATVIAGKHPLHVVQALLGHTNVSTTSVYLHAKDEDLRRAVETLA